jgi:hypothetical protein
MGRPFREDAIRAFPGDDIGRVKYSDVDKDFLTELELHPLRDVRQLGAFLVREKLKIPHEIGAPI